MQQTTKNNTCRCPFCLSLSRTRSVFSLSRLFLLKLSLSLSLSRLLGRPYPGKIPVLLPPTAFAPTLLLHPSSTHVAGRFFSSSLPLFLWRPKYFCVHACTSTLRRPEMDPGCSCSSYRQCLVCHIQPVYTTATDSFGVTPDTPVAPPAINGSIERCVVCVPSRLLLAGRCVVGLTCHGRSTRSSTNPDLDGHACRCIDRHCNKCYRTAAADTCHICRYGHRPLGRTIRGVRCDVR